MADEPSDKDRMTKLEDRVLVLETMVKKLVKKQEEKDQVANAARSGFYGEKEKP